MCPVDDTPVESPGRLKDVGAPHDVRGTKKSHSWLWAVVFAAAVIVAVLGTYEWAARTVLGEAPPEDARRFPFLRDILRDILFSVLVGVIVAVYFMRRVMRGLPFRGDEIRAGEGPRGDAVLIRRNRWLVNTRWAVLGVTAVAVLVGAFAVPLVTPAARIPLGGALVLMAVTNVLLDRYVRREAHPGRALAVQMGMDLAFLTVLLHFSGGIENPLTVVYLLHVILAGTLLDRHAAFGIAGLACALLVALGVLEATRALPHYSFSLFPHAAGHGSHDPRYVASVLGASCLLAGVASALTTSLRESLRSSERDFLKSYKMAVLGRLSAGVAHEINNPLGVAVGRTKLLLERSGDSVAVPQEDLRAIDRHLDRVATIVRGMLTYARSRGWKHEPVELGEALRHVATGLVLPGGKAPRVTVDLHLPAEHLYVRGSRGEISQILVNLIENALDAMPQGGTVHVGGARENGTALLWIQDTGEGMSSDVRSRIFEPFFTTKSEGRGTGLGLAIVHTLVNAHRGTIRVDSAPGKGTRFEIRIPLLEGERLDA